MNNQVPRLFVEWFRDEYDSGSVNRDNYLWGAAYAQGLADSSTNEEQRDRMQRLANILTSGAGLIEVLVRHKVQAP